MKELICTRYEDNLEMFLQCIFPDLFKCIMIMVSRSCVHSCVYSLLLLLLLSFVCLFVRSFFRLFVYLFVLSFVCLFNVSWNFTWDFNFTDRNKTCHELLLCFFLVFLLNVPEPDGISGLEQEDNRGRSSCPFFSCQPVAGSNPRGIDSCQG